MKLLFCLTTKKEPKYLKGPQIPELIINVVYLCPAFKRASAPAARADAGPARGAGLRSPGLAVQPPASPTCFSAC